jgi:hypothetical protein
LPFDLLQNLLNGAFLQVFLVRITNCIELCKIPS